MKIANTDREFFIPSKWLEEFHWNFSSRLEGMKYFSFKKRCDLWQFWKLQKPGFHLLFKRYNFRKTTSGWESNWLHSPRHSTSSFRVNLLRYASSLFSKRSMQERSKPPKFSTLLFRQKKHMSISYKVYIWRRIYRMSLPLLFSFWRNKKTMI